MMVLVRFFGCFPTRGGTWGLWMEQMCAGRGRLACLAAAALHRLTQGGSRNLPGLEPLPCTTSFLPTRACSLLHRTSQEQLPATILLLSQQRSGLGNTTPKAWCVHVPSGSALPPSSSIWRPPLALGARPRGLPSPAGSSAKLVSRVLGSNEVSRLIGQDSTTSTQASVPVGAAPASVGLAFGGSSSLSCLRWAPV